MAELVSIKSAWIDYDVFEDGVDCESTESEVLHRGV